MISSLLSEPLKTPFKIPVAEPKRPTLHCSARLNKGQHANPYHQPRTINN